MLGRFLHSHHFYCVKVQLGRNDDGYLVLLMLNGCTAIIIFKLKCAFENSEQMLFDPNNHIVKLCAEGIALEGGGNDEALELYMQAWNEAQTDVERFIAAHYVARVQNDVAGKLKWDETALSFALKIDDHEIKGSYPSLYLNIAKCYEDLGDMDKARECYDLAYSYTNLLPDDGYGKIIKGGIEAGMGRVKTIIAK